MDPSYWIGRWSRGEIGWHQTEVEPKLIANFPKEPAKGRVLVPLCGKTLDIGWLLSQGHEITGVEVSETAIRQLFEEGGMTPKLAQLGPFTMYSHGKLRILNGDFFALTPELLAPVHFVYDRAALIALPPEGRTRYAAKLKELGKGATILQLTLERVPLDAAGPPFSVTSAELELLYGDAFAIRELSREPVDLGEERKAYESVYLLSSRP